MKNQRHYVKYVGSITVSLTLIYLAFIKNSEGALNVLLLMASVAIILNLMLLIPPAHEEAIKHAIKNDTKFVNVYASTAISIFYTGVFAWHGFTVLAIFMLLATAISYHWRQDREKERKQRGFDTLSRINE
jgi:hypothetical protein